MSMFNIITYNIYPLFTDYSLYFCTFTIQINLYKSISKYHTPLPLPFNYVISHTHFVHPSTSISTTTSILHICDELPTGTFGKSTILHTIPYTPLPLPFNYVISHIHFVHPSTSICTTTSILDTCN